MKQEPRTTRHWKFTADHWWRWWDKRKADTKASELRANIEAMRRKLP